LRVLLHVDVEIGVVLFDVGLRGAVGHGSVLERRVPVVRVLQLKQRTQNLHAK
jgi:hypothetical protein